MKKRGFTLIELLGVIIVLGLLAVITAPKVIDSINDSREKAYNNQINSLISAAKKWGTSNSDKLPENSIQVSLPTGEQIAKAVGDNAWGPGNYTAKTLSEWLVGGLNSDAVPYAYWTSTPHKNKVTNTWVVTYSKQLQHTKVSNNAKVGVRPVLTISKEHMDRLGFCKAKTVATTGNIPQGNFAYGDEYTCKLGDNVENTFFVLENQGNEVALILNKNFDNEVLTWCNQAGNNPSKNDCGADGLTEKLESIKSTWLNGLTIQYALPLSTLVDEGYIKQTKIINPKTDEKLSGCIKISYDQEYSQYKYEYTDDKTFCGR